MAGNSEKLARDMRWLLFGCRGWIGGQIDAHLKRASQTVVAADRRFFRYEDVASVVKASGAERIVCALGRTYGGGHSTIDGLEGDEAWPDAVLANHHLPIWIARAARECPGAHVLYIGTGCIYSGAGRREFLETDPANFSGSAYSRIKAMTDVVLGGEPHVLNARIRMPIARAASPRDFVCKLLSYRTVCSDGPNSMSVLGEVLPALLALAHGGVVGTLNAVNPGPLTNAEVLSISRRKAFEAHAHIDTTSTADLDLLARRSCCVLSCAKIQAALGDLPEEIRAVHGAARALSDAGRLIETTLVERKEPYRLLVTGGCGFIGSHFVDRWLDAFPQDTVIDVDSICAASGSSRRNPRAGRDDAPPELRARYRHVYVDISAASADLQLYSELVGGNVTHVVHFAARTHVDDSFEGPTSIDFVHTNVVGTHRLLEACRRYVDDGGALARFLHVSTDEVYGDRHEREKPASARKTPLEPTNPYAASKAGAEMIVKSYASSYRLPCLVVRCNNAYGPRQYDTKVIPKFCSLALRGEQLPLHGEGLARRHFVHVRDVAEAICLLLRSGEPDGRAYNVSGDEEISVVELAGRILTLAGRPLAGGTCSVSDRPYNDRSYRVCDAELRALGWRPETSLDDGLLETFRWVSEREPRSV